MLTSLADVRELYSLRLVKSILCWSLEREEMKSLGIWDGECYMDNGRVQIMPEWDKAWDMIEKV